MSRLKPLWQRKASFTARPNEPQVRVQTAVNRSDSLPFARSWLGDEKLSMFIDDECLEDTMAPFFQVRDRQGDKVKVSFMVEFYKKIVYLRRGITRISFVGWTHEENVVPGTWHQ